MAAACPRTCSFTLRPAWKPTESRVPCGRRFESVRAAKRMDSTAAVPYSGGGGHFEGVGGGAAQLFFLGVVVLSDEGSGRTHREGGNVVCGNLRGHCACAQKRGSIRGRVAAACRTALQPGRHTFSPLRHTLRHTTSLAKLVHPSGISQRASGRARLRVPSSDCHGGSNLPGQGTSPTWQLHPVVAGKAEARAAFGEVHRNRRRDSQRHRRGSQEGLQWRQRLPGAQPGGKGGQRPGRRLHTTHQQLPLDGHLHVQPQTSAAAS